MNMTLNEQLEASLAEVEYGIFDNLPYEAYRCIRAVNYSTLKHIKRSPMAYRYFMDHPMPATPAMQLGSHTHRMILEPDTVGDFAVWGEREGQNVRRGDIWNQFQAECAVSGKEIITKEERHLMVQMSAAVRKSALASRYLDGGRSEVSIVWHDKTFNRPCKARIDKIKVIGGQAHISDLKTTRDCRRIPFGNEAYRMGYHIQSAMYEQGWKTLTGEAPVMTIVAAQKNPPFEPAVYSVSEDVLWKGNDDFKYLMKTLAECERTNTWPPAEESITDLTLPSYAYGSDADEFNLSDLAE